MNQTHKCYIHYVRPVLHIPLIIGTRESVAVVGKKGESDGDMVYGRASYRLRAAAEWDIPEHDCMFRLLRLRPASDQDTSLEDEPRLLDQVGKLSDVVADRAFARSKV